QGLSEVAWDETAALAGTQHAQEMAQYGYISHRNLDGYGPEHRYAMAGGTHYVMENVHVTWHSSGGEPRSADAWEAWVRDAQASLMESELHRANILAPEHTHVGIGMAYDPATGYFSIAQEFVNQYTTVQPPLLTASLGQQMELVGWLNAGVSNPLLNIAYEPLPVPLSLDELQPESYASQAESYAVPDVSLAADGKFTSDFTLNHEEQPGLYHIRLWVDTEFGNVQAVNLVIRVQ
ncbi:MAG: CAP domain-containing protein, partial [Candidatus Micrarchaeota archaeon]